jgi:hypothetical protein
VVLEVSGYDLSQRFGTYASDKFVNLIDDDNALRFNLSLHEILEVDSPEELISVPRFQYYRLDLHLKHVLPHVSHLDVGELFAHRAARGLLTGDRRYVDEAIVLIEQSRTVLRTLLGQVRVLEVARAEYQLEDVVLHHSLEL